jgi:thiamine-monophosphate kinase
MNEPEFVEYLQRTFSFGFGAGIGDDTSVVEVEPGDGKQLVTKDILVEGVHFSLEYMTLEELALKSLAVNLSDIAAMGGVPQYFYLGLAFPGHLAKERVLDFFAGLKEGCKRWQVELAGGDFSSSPLMMISITVIGKTAAPVYRQTARCGDLIGITGPTGESAAGLRLLLAGERQGDFVRKHIHVTPEIEKGRLLAPFVNAMIDVSDGILLDLGRVLSASGKGAKLYYQNLPVSRQLKNLCRERGWNEYETVLAGGEDYVLIFTISKENEQALKTKDIRYTIIGEVTDSGGLLVEHNGKPVKIERSGYDHFK